MPCPAATRPAFLNVHQITPYLCSKASYGSLHPLEPSTQALTHLCPHSPFWPLVGQPLYNPRLPLLESNILTPEHALVNCEAKMPTTRILSIAQQSPCGCPADGLSSTTNQARVLNCFSTKSTHHTGKGIFVFTLKIKDDYSAWRRSL